MRWAHLALPPGVRQTLEKLFEIRIAIWQRVDRLTRCQSGEVVLDRPNLIEEPERIEGATQRPESILYGQGDRV